MLAGVSAAATIWLRRSRFEMTTLTATMTLHCS
jgi:hypothetical protein